MMTSPSPDTSATSIHTEKRLTIDARADLIAEKVAAEPSEAWVIWCDTDYEADALTARIPGALEVRGSMTPDEKEARIEAFSSGSARILITKPSVCGFGLNWQHCARMAFVGLSFSYESYYQAIRRCWRFGQKREVHVHVACADTEESIWQTVSRKAGDHDAMKAQMQAAMSRAAGKALRADPYIPHKTANLPAWMTA
jgi:superfamily II DNA/RNA helicase